MISPIPALTNPLGVRHNAPCFAGLPIRCTSFGPQRATTRKPDTPVIPRERPVDYVVPPELKPKGFHPAARLFEALVLDAKTSVPEPFKGFITQQRLKILSCKSVFHAGYELPTLALALADITQNTLIFCEEYYPVRLPVKTDATSSSSPHERHPKALQPKPMVMSKTPEKSLVYLRERDIPLESVWGHEVGHFLGHWSGRQYGMAECVSHSPEFEATTQQDMQALDIDTQKAVLSWADLSEVYTEACIEMFGLPGVHRMAKHPDRPLNKVFPRTQNWIYRSLIGLGVIPNTTFG